MRIIAERLGNVSHGLRSVRAKAPLERDLSYNPAMKGARMPKRSSVKRKKRAKSMAAKGYWHFDHLVQGATEEKMDRIWDAFIDAVEKEGLICTGTYHPAGRCKECVQDD